jgi:aspartyl-tRNA(Asn)/glutamyl-tRNA(Gln) amidotransferase subunit C
MNKNASKSTINVKHVAQLAKLPLTDDDLEKFEKQLGEILDLVNNLQKVDTSNVQPTNQVTGLTNIFREDKVQPSLTQSEALSNAPRTHNGYFVVDAIFE